LRTRKSAFEVPKLSLWAEVRKYQDQKQDVRRTALEVQEARMDE